jgi:excisionase family DNA binding protein
MSMKIPFDGKVFISVSDAGRELGVTADYVARLARMGRIPARRLGRHWYVERDAVTSWHAHSPAADPATNTNPAAH